MMFFRKEKAEEVVEDKKHEISEMEYKKLVDAFHKRLDEIVVLMEPDKEQANINQEQKLCSFNLDHNCSRKCTAYVEAKIWPRFPGWGRSYIGADPRAEIISPRCSRLK